MSGLGRLRPGPANRQVGHIRYAAESGSKFRALAAPRANLHQSEFAWLLMCPRFSFSDRCSGRLRPSQTREDRPSHNPVLVVLRQEAQFFGEMGDALAVAGLGERVRYVGTPIAALRTVGVEQALQVHRHIAERIGFE